MYFIETTTLYQCAADLTCLLCVRCFIDPIQLKEKKNRFQAVAMLGRASHYKQTQQQGQTAYSTLLV